MLPTHSYDTGSAWMSLAYQGWISGYVVHGMAGFDYDRARSELGVPDEFHVNAMCAIGRPARSRICRSRFAGVRPQARARR